jgi:hypothetical protein
MLATLPGIKQIRVSVQPYAAGTCGVVGSVMNEPKINKNQQKYIFSQKKASTINQFLTNLMTVFKGIFTNGAFSRSTPIM